MRTVLVQGKVRSTGPNSEGNDGKEEQMTAWKQQTQTLLD